MEPIEQQLTELVAEQKTFIAKTREEITNLGAAKTETTEAISKVREKLDELQKQTDAIDLKMNTARFLPGTEEVKSFGDMITEAKEFQEAAASGWAPLRSKNGRICIPIADAFAGRKSNITTTSGLNIATSGVIQQQRIPGVVFTAMQELRIRDLLRRRVITTTAFDWVKQTTRTNNASPQTEAVAKGESTYAWQTGSGVVSTIAHFANVTRQALDDVAWLRDMLNNELMYGLLLKEESELLSGDGLGAHLNGLITQATARSSAYDVASDTKLDKLRHAKLQARLAGLGTAPPDAYVLHPTDMHTIELLKTEEGGANKGLYIIGDPKTGPTIKMIWGLPVVESDSIASGTFLIGSFQNGAELIDRMEPSIEISYEHSSNFTANLATVLCEERIGLAVTRPTAFISGSY